MLGQKGKIVDLEKYRAVREGIAREQSALEYLMEMDKADRNDAPIIDAYEQEDVSSVRGACSGCLGLSELPPEDTGLIEATRKLAEINLQVECFIREF